MKFLRSFKYAIEGFLHCVKSERNFRAHLIATIVVISLAAMLELSAFEIVALAFAIALVLICEMINTAIERTIDAVKECCENDTPHLDGLRKTAKDVAAGAVFISAIFATIVGGVILIPAFISTIRIFFNF